MIILIVLTLFFSASFWGMIILRLFDNSSIVFLNQGIFITSKVVNSKTIKEHITKTEDISFKQKLKKLLVLKRIHNIFMCTFFITCVLLLLLKTTSII